jgi:peptidoglycan/xylan/chitin deacetylase (PgdA/CDA1 family)
MDAAELRGLQKAGMEIGSHSHSHRRLPELEAQVRRRELSRSKAELQDMLGTEVRSFAYPYGAFDDLCAEEVQDAGYHSACTTGPGWMLRDGDPFRLRRLTVFNQDTLGTFKRKLAFASHDVGTRDMVWYWMQRAARRLPGFG